MSKMNKQSRKDQPKFDTNKNKLHMANRIGGFDEAVGKKQKTTKND
jgi:hypothetical protein